MKKLLFFIMLLIFDNVFAIEDIQINNEYLIPKFETNIFEYNYFTNSTEVNIDVKKTNDEIVYGNGLHNINEGKNVIKVSSSIGKEYIIKVFKNYKNNNEKGYLEELIIDGYDIEYEKDKYEYYININDEEYLNINYLLSNDNVIFSISGNGNFNKSDNIIKISANDKEYIIHALKSKSVSYIKKEPKEEMSKNKKEIVIIGISTISLLIIVIFFYSLFIFN